MSGSMSIYAGWNSRGHPSIYETDPQIVFWLSSAQLGTRPKESSDNIKHVTLPATLQSVVSEKQFSLWWMEKSSLCDFTCSAWKFVDLHSASSEKILVFLVLSEFDLKYTSLYNPPRLLTQTYVYFEFATYSTLPFSRHLFLLLD